MTSSQGWECDGIPKDGKNYPGLGGAHTPCINYAPDCEECGLPKESSIPKSRPILGKIAIIATIALIVGIAGGGTLYTIRNRCEAGLERIEGQCIDPFQQPYEEARQQGDRAIKNSQSYQTLEELQNAKKSLEETIEQLETIPENTSIYEQVQDSLTNYQDELKTIDTRLKTEQDAQQLFTEVEAIASKFNRDIIKNFTDKKQLEQAKSKLIKAVEKLELISSDSLVAEKKQEQLIECRTRIGIIEYAMGNIQKPSPITPQPKAQPSPQPKPKAQPSPQPKNNGLPSCKIAIFGRCL